MFICVFSEVESKWLSVAEMNVSEINLFMVPTVLSTFWCPFGLIRVEWLQQNNSQLVRVDWIRFNYSDIRSAYFFPVFPDTVVWWVLLSNLTFIEPCIIMYFYSKTNWMHQCIKFILFGVTLYMFRTVFPSIISSSRLHIQQPNRYCCLFASMQSAVSVWHMRVAVCTVLNSWWWTERQSETCTVSFQNKINVRHWCIWLVLL